MTAKTEEPADRAAEIAELRERHKASLRRADEINNELMEEVRRYAAGTERPVLWSVYNRMHLRALEAEARAAAMERAMESTATDALKHRGCHRELMAQCLRAERAEAELRGMADEAQPAQPKQPPMDPVHILGIGADADEAQQPEGEAPCTCADAGDCFAPAGHYADCPQAAEAQQHESVCKCPTQCGHKTQADEAQTAAGVTP